LGRGVERGERLRLDWGMEVEGMRNCMICDCTYIGTSGRKAGSFCSMVVLYHYWYSGQEALQAFWMYGMNRIGT
jgi:hypothetical protein